MIWLSIGILWSTLTIWLYRRQRRTGHDGYAFDLLAGGLLLALTIGFFWRTLSGEVYQPADGGDLVSFLFPTYRFAAAQLQQGTLPLWNPTLYAGAPFISDIQAGFLYPPNLLLFWSWPNFDYWVMQALAIGHLYWTGLGLYVLLRTWQWPQQTVLSRPAALFGALAFQFSDPLLVHLGNLNLIAVLSWLPWILVIYHQALSRRSVRWAAGAGFCFALANFAGHAQSTFYVGLVLGLYTLGYWLIEPGQWRRHFPTIIANLQYPIVLYAMMLLLSAPLLLPTLELARYTERGDFTYQDTVAFSLAPTQAIGLLTPGFFGRGPALHWSLWARVETPYAGVATLILAVAALLLVPPLTRRRLWLWVGIALLGFCTALGVYALVHGWWTALVPFFGQFRAPARALVLWTLGVAIVAAHGVDAVQAQVRRLGRTDQGERLLAQGLRWGAGFLLGIALPLLYLALLLTQENETSFLRTSVAALALTFATGFWWGTWALLVAHRLGWVSRRGLGILLIALLYFDLSATGAYTDISPTDPTRGYEHPELVAFLQREAALMAPTPFRIDTLTDIADQWQPDSAALYGLQDVGGIANPLMLQQWRLLWEGLGGRASLLYDLLNVRYVIVRDETPLPEGKFTLAFDAPGALAVYRNENALARGWLIHAAQLVTDQTAALAALQDPAFDPRQGAVLLAEEANALSLQAATGTEQVEITGYGSNELVLQVAATAPALLVISEMWYPGWRVTVDEVPATLLLVNGALRGVGVPAGNSTVHFWFAPDSWRIGLLAAIAGWVLLILIFIFEGSKGRRRAHMVAHVKPLA